jgi:hypothetical protein
MIYSSRSSSPATFSSRLGDGEFLQVRGSGEEANERGGVSRGVPEFISAGVGSV